MPPSCALVGGFPIGARVALLWQHNVNRSYKLASTSQYDNIVRMRNVSKCSVLTLCLVYSVDNKNILDFITDSHFCHQL